MVDSVNGNGGVVRSLVTPKNDPVLERKERKAEGVQSDSTRSSDTVEISDQAQSLAQVEESARLVRQQLERTDVSLSGGRVVDQSV
jgi:hypothetical protein